jgi:mono/diheme cytochrome c family protein
MFGAGFYGLGVQARAEDVVPRDAVTARGEHIARLVCSACHEVARDQEYPPILAKPAPSFSEIAHRPGTSVESLQRFIVSTHWDVNALPMTMPNPMLSRDEARSVARYIVSLRRP